MALAEKDSVVSVAEDVLFSLYKQEECLALNLGVFAQEPPVWFNLVEEKHRQLKGQLDLLQVVLSASDEITANRPADVTDFTGHILQLVKDLTSGYEDICRKVNDLCDCGSPQ
jgi:hypothetical protein